MHRRFAPALASWLPAPLAAAPAATASVIAPAATASLIAAAAAASLLAACATAPGDAPARATPGSVTVAADTLESFDGRRIPAERGTLRLTGPGTGPALEVSWLRLPATTATPASPVVFLMGGPGVPATVIARVPPYFDLFDRLRAVADVILLDQRGTGDSRPALDCEPVAPPPPDFLADADRLEDAIVATYAPCVAAWRDRGVSAQWFGVGDVARDVDAIRRHLGTDQVSLLGFSYGTRLALEYARLFPERTDRVVLQGVLGYDHGGRLPTVLDALLARVDSLDGPDPDDLRAALARTLGALDAEPLRVPVTDPAGDTVAVTIGPGGLRALLTQAIADSRLPALLSSLDRGDTRLLALMAGAIYRDLAAGGGPLFGRAVYCSAPPSAARLAEARRLAPASLLGEPFDNVPVSPAFCDALGIRPGRPPAEIAARAPHGGTALLIEGTLDDRTPAGNAADVAPWFRDAAIITVVNGPHELLPAREIQDLVVAFLRGDAAPARTIAWPAPRFLSLPEALQPRQRPGGR